MEECWEGGGKEAIKKKKKEEEEEEEARPRVEKYQIIYTQRKWNPFEKCFFSSVFGQLLTGIIST